ncbi:MAG: hypothetical protein QNJ29_05160 [Rhizobiaceae bacterium]|nr:hypothetical protein [Rhizobiaceae bacterium]
MDEYSFLELIDCKFPYEDRSKSMEIIELAASISDNAMFIVLDEICRPPKNVAVTEITLTNTLYEWKKRTSHPLSESIGSLALRMINGYRITPAEVLAIMYQVSKFKGLIAALNIVYMSCSIDSEEVENAYKNILDNWKL